VFPLFQPILFTNQPIQIKSFGPGEWAKSNHSGSLGQLPRLIGAKQIMIQINDVPSPS
jgi:hypothetical protein